MVRRPSARPEPRLSEAGRVGDRPLAHQHIYTTYRYTQFVSEKVSDVNVSRVLFVVLAMPGTPRPSARKCPAMCARYAHVATGHVALRPRALLPSAPTNTRSVHNP